MIEQLRFPDLAPVDLVRMAYLLLLRREIDPVGLASWQERIARGQFTVDLLVELLMGSPEYKSVNRVPFAKLVHGAREAWIRQIGAYDSILDIGGSSPNLATGALLELGYQHRPRRLMILDLPPEAQYWGAPRFPQDRKYQYEWGSIEYLHGRAEAIDELAELQDLRFDMIFMGQVIEHLDPPRLPAILRWVAGHLAAGGKFIFDTPNRLITAIQKPDGFIDPDHKTEYTPPGLETLLRANGLQVMRRWGLLHLPSTAIGGSFNPMEAYETLVLTDRVEESYLFAFECAVAG